MIIKSLTLNNFRQFTGEQTIDFSSDPNKKVTIVMAESGVGKTTLIQSFQWILYGVCKYTKILNEDIRNDMLPGENQRVSASIVVEHEDKVYTITRKQDFHKINVRVDSDDTVLLIEYKDENGNSKQARNRDANAIIKKLMHKDLFPYFPNTRLINSVYATASQWKQINQRAYAILRTCHYQLESYDTPRDVQRHT